MKKSMLWSILFVVLVAGLGFACESPATPTPAPTPEPLTLEGIVTLAKPYTVFIESQFPRDKEGSGTGIIFQEDGLIVTNAHVVQGASSIRVHIPDRAGALSAELLGMSPCDDLAVIKVKGKGFTAAQFGDSNELELGREVIVVGYPLGDDNLSVTSGIVSKLQVTYEAQEDLIQTNAAVNLGNSGGPLLSPKGEVVGIITSKQTGTAIEGTAFAISSNIAGELLPVLAQGENVDWIGIEAFPLKELDPSLTAGLWLVDVAANSPADKAGLQAGDVLVTVGGQAVTSIADLCSVLRNTQDLEELTYKVIPWEEIVGDEPTATPTPELVQVFEEGFDDSDCNWEYPTIFNGTDIEMGCTQSRFKFQVNQAGSLAYSLPGNRQAYTDFLLQVQVEQVEGPESLQGIIFRYQDLDHFYLFTIRGDGRYAIFRYKDGDSEALIPWTPSEYINRGPGGNLLMIGVSDSLIVVSINGEVVDETADDSFVAGEIGLVAGSFEEGVGTPIVYFDDLVIWEMR